MLKTVIPGRGNERAFLTEENITYEILLPKVEPESDQVLSFN